MLADSLYWLTEKAKLSIVQKILNKGCVTIEKYNANNHKNQVKF